MWWGPNLQASGVVIGPKIAYSLYEISCKKFTSNTLTIICHKTMWRHCLSCLIVLAVLSCPPFGGAELSLGLLETPAGGSTLCPGSGVDLGRELLTL